MLQLLHNWQQRGQLPENLLMAQQILYLPQMIYLKDQQIYILHKVLQGLLLQFLKEQGRTLKELALSPFRQKRLTLRMILDILPRPLFHLRLRFNWEQ